MTVQGLSPLYTLLSLGEHNPKQAFMMIHIFLFVAESLFTTDCVLFGKPEDKGCLFYSEASVLFRAVHIGVDLIHIIVRELPRRATAVP